MKYILSIFTLVTLFAFTTDTEPQAIEKSTLQVLLENMSPEEREETIKELLEHKGSCEVNGVRLYGKVQFVTSFPDIKIKYVDSFPDIKVKFVSSFPDDCGEWQKVNSFPDFKVQVVNSFPDVKVKVVDSFPGM
ncbi:MAG: hypothetical protein ACPGJS_07820 [Flammeovirgaceae bacterium]